MIPVMNSLVLILLRQRLKTYGIWLEVKNVCVCVNSCLHEVFQPCFDVLAEILWPGLIRAGCFGLPAQILPPPVLEDNRRLL